MFTQDDSQRIVSANLYSGALEVRKFPVVFKSAGKNNEKIKDKREFLRKIGFQLNGFWFLV